MRTLDRYVLRFFWSSYGICLVTLVMLFVVGETEFRNQHGEVVAYSRSTVIETAAPLQE